MKKSNRGKEAKNLARVVIQMFLPNKVYVHYFAHPYSSRERGLNEYTNGLIRQYIPQGIDFDKDDN